MSVKRHLSAYPYLLPTKQMPAVFSQTCMETASLLHNRGIEDKIYYAKQGFSLMDIVGPGSVVELI